MSLFTATRRFVLRNRFTASLLAALFITVTAPGLSFACPGIGGFPDINCDRQANVVILGDSLGYGYGDLVNGNQGGYVVRTSKQFPKVKFKNYSKQGLRTFEALSMLQDAFNGKNPTFGDDLDTADVVILDVGRNDRWLFGTPIATYRQLKRAADLIRNKTTARIGSSPLVITAVLMLPNRGSQGPWVKELNSYIFKSSKPKTPADLRFDLVSKRLLNTDQIHPTSLGYSALSKTLTAYFKKTLLSHAKAFRLDADKDGVYDIFETLKFGTDPTLLDTDGDGKSDGQEIFTTHTDPLMAD